MKFRDYLKEEKWSADIDTKWKPPEGLFDTAADNIVKILKKESKDLKQAMSRLNFYINRAGKNFSDNDKKRLESAKDKLKKAFE